MSRYNYSVSIIKLRVLKDRKILDFDPFVGIGSDPISWDRESNRKFLNFYRSDPDPNYPHFNYEDLSFDKDFSLFPDSKIKEVILNCTDRTILSAKNVLKSVLLF